MSLGPIVGTIVGLILIVAIAAFFVNRFFVANQPKNTKLTGRRGNNVDMTIVDRNNVERGEGITLTHISSN